MARILLIDDDESVARTLSMVIEQEGHNVTWITDSGSVLEYLSKEKYDLILTDIRMAPLSGMELMKIVRDKYPEIKIIVISAYGAESTIKECLSMGCVDYLRKPVTITRIIEAVNKALYKN